MQVEQRPDSQACEPGPEAACGFRRAQALGCAGAAFIVSGLGAVLLLLRRRSPRHARHPGRWASSLGVVTVLVGATVLLAYLYDTPLLSILVIVAGMITAAVAARIALLIGSRFDESKRKLRESEERRRAFLEAAMDGFWLADTQGRLLEVNDAYCRMSGYSARELLAMRIHDLEARDDVNAASAYIEELMVRGERRFESRHRRKDGGVFDVEVSARYQSSEGGRVVVFLRDIAERKQVERYRDLSGRILQILNEKGPMQGSIQRVLSELKEETGFDAVGLRMQVGDDFPYFAQQGFSGRFLQTENTLIARGAAGEVCRSPEGNVLLECTCGQVLSGRIDPANPLFTPGGTFWTNDSFRPVDLPAGQPPPLHPRDACVYQGYASAALVPVRNKDRIVGLIQLNDRRKGCFTRGAVEQLEGIGTHIGAALMRGLAEDVLDVANRKKLAAEKEAMQSLEREREALALSSAARAAVDTLNAMGDGVMLLDMDGRVLSFNLSLEKMTGIPRAEAFEQPVRTLFSRVLSPAEFKLADEVLAKALHGQAGALPPVSLLNRNGERTPTIPSVAFVRGAYNRPTAIVVTLRDLSVIHAMQKSLRESDQKYRELVEHANSCIMRITPDHTITFFNDYAQAFFGFEASEVVGRNVVGTIVPETDSWGRDLRELMRDISVHPELHASNENENCRKDGTRVWLHWANRAIRDDRGNLVEILCVGTDITRRREMEAEAMRYQQRLQDLSEKLAASEEEDRWRISRYIHDTIIQNLSLSAIRLGSLAKPLADAQLGEEARTLRQVKELLNAAIDECRMVMSDLTPSLLYELGLVPALNELAQQVQEKHGRRMIVDDDGLAKPMSHALRGLLFACTREMIVNALKHAGLCEIRVSVSRRENDLVLQVSDDGKGFDPGVVNTHPERSGGFGLFSIRERMEGLGGRLELKSAPGKGTTATIAVPLLEGEGMWEVEKQQMLAVRGA